MGGNGVGEGCLGYNTKQICRCIITFFLNCVYILLDGEIVIYIFSIFNISVCIYYYYICFVH